MDSLSQFLLLIVIVLLQLISRVSLVNLPSGMPQAMYCEGCIATVTELSKKVNKPSLDSREVRVVEALERICDYSNFGSYGYSPPKTAQACNYLLEHFDEDIETLLLKTSELQVLETEVCFKLSKACQGVDRSKKPVEETEVRFNDEKLDLSQQGSPSHQQTQDPNYIPLDLNDEHGVENAVNKLQGVLGNIGNQGEDGQEDDDIEEEEEDLNDTADKTEL